MNKITNYMLVNDDDYDCLSEKINRYISDGWQPYGHLTNGTNGFGNRHYISQALVKYEENDNE